MDLTVIEESIEKIRKGGFRAGNAVVFLRRLFAENLAIHGNYRRAESINKNSNGVQPVRANSGVSIAPATRTMGITAAAERHLGPGIRRSHLHAKKH